MSQLPFAEDLYLLRRNWGACTLDMRVSRQIMCQNSLMLLALFTDAMCTHGADDAGEDVFVPSGRFALNQQASKQSDPWTRAGESGAYGIGSCAYRSESSSLRLFDTIQYVRRCIFSLE